jgi:hypothetical protein
MMRVTFFVLLLSMALSKDAFILVDESPRPWTPLLLDAFEIYKIKLLFIYNESRARNDIVSYQIRKAGHFIVTLSEFAAKTERVKEDVLPVVVALPNKFITRTVIDWLQLQIPDLKEKGYRFPRWDKVKYK